MNLKDIEIFKDLSAKEIEKVKKIAIEITCDEKQILCKEGDIGDKLYIIISGAVEIKKNSTGSSIPHSNFIAFSR